MLRRLVFGWIEDTVLAHDTMQCVGLICGLLTQSQGSETFVELCRSRIQEELEGGAGEDAGGHGGAARRERSLLWFLNILQRVMKHLKDPEASLPYAEDLQATLLQAMNSCRSRSSVQASSLLLAYWLFHLVHVELMEAKAIVGETEEREHYRHWHTSIPKEKLYQTHTGGESLTQWRTPTAKSIGQALKLIREVTEVAVERMQHVFNELDEEGKGGRKDLVMELERYIPWVDSSVKIMGILVPEEEDPPTFSSPRSSQNIQDLEEDEELVADYRIFTGGNSGNSQNLTPEDILYIRGLRTRISQLVTRTIHLLLAHYAGELYALSLLESMAADLILEKEVTIQDVEGMTAIHNFQCSSWANEGDLDRKGGSRYLLVHSAEIYYRRRVAYNAHLQGQGTQGASLDTRTGLIKALIAIGTSDYTDVQNAGAYGLKRVLKQCCFWKDMIIDGALHVIESYGKWIYEEGLIVCEIPISFPSFSFLPFPPCFA